jgi:hypothetical protein
MSREAKTRRATTMTRCRFWKKQPQKKQSRPKKPPSQSVSKQYKLKRMQIRRPIQRKLKDIPFLPVVLLSAPIVFIFLLSSKFHHKEPTSSSTMRSGVKGCFAQPAIAYDLVSTEKESNVLRYAATEKCKDGLPEPVTVERWAHLMTHNDTAYAQNLALNFTEILKNAPFDAYKFETKGVTSGNAGQKQFEFVLVDYPSLYTFADAKQNADTFSEHLNCLPEDAVGCVFPNLDGTSTMISPKGTALGENTYGHLAAFVRRAPKEQVNKMWRLAVQTFVDVLVASKSRDKVWFSTDGIGVAWVHFRLDPRPKYYSYKPFRQEVP